MEAFFKVRKNDQRGQGHTATIPESEEKHCLIKLTKKYFKCLKNWGSGNQSDLVLPKIVKFGSSFKIYQEIARAESCRIEQSKILKSMDLNPKIYGLHTGKVSGVRAL